MWQRKKTSSSGTKPLAVLFLSSFIVILMICGCSDSVTNNHSDKKEIELNNLFELASKEADSVNIGRGIQFIDSAVAKKKLNVSQKLKVLGFKSAVYSYRKHPANAMIYTDSLLQAIEENGKDKYNEEYMLANYAKGDLLFSEKRYDEAYKYFFIARHTRNAAVDLCALAEYSYRIGMILFKQSRFIEAAENFEDGFNQSEKCTLDFAGFYRRQELLANAGLSFLKAGKYDSALMYCNKALQYITQYDGKFKPKEYFNDIAKGVIFETEGEAFKETGNYAKAKELLKRCIEINTKKGYDNENAQVGQLNLAEVYFLSNNFDSTGLLLKQTRQSLDTIQNKQVEIDWNRLMWKYSESKNETARAFTYMKHYTLLQDSALDVKSKLNAYDVSSEIKTLEDQYKINSLQKENKLKNLYLLIFLITTALGIVIFLFSLYILKNTRNNFKVLKGLNRQIEDQKIVLEQTLLQLEDRNKEKDRILRVVAHDLRTPIASISMLVELIMDEVDDDAKTEMLKLIKSSSDNSFTLISEILESAGTELKSELQKENVDINVLLQDALAPLYLKADKKQQTIELELLAENQQVLVNKEKMQRVITNLVTNAIKFSPTYAQIKAKTLNTENFVEILIQDNGIGIPENLKTKVFDMFTEAKRPGTAGEKPFGLGLSICRQIVEAHGGSICFESEEGKGTTFFVKLNYN